MITLKAMHLILRGTKYFYFIYNFTATYRQMQQYTTPNELRKNFQYIILMSDWMDNH